MKVTDEDDLLSWTNRVADQLFSAFASRPAIGFQPHPDTDALLHEPNLHLEFLECSHPALPVDVGSILPEVDYSCEEN